jgi:hypothetical protein
VDDLGVCEPLGRHEASRAARGVAQAKRVEAKVAGEGASEVGERCLVDREAEGDCERLLGALRGCDLHILLRAGDHRGAAALSNHGAGAQAGERLGGEHSAVDKVEEVTDTVSISLCGGGGGGRR